MAISAQTSKQALLDLINKDNGTTFALDDLVIPLPVDIPDADIFSGESNSKVTVSATNFNEIRGEVEMSYIRRPLSSILGLSNYEIAVPDATPEKVSAALAEALLTSGDLAVPFEEGSYTITCTPLDASDPNSQDGRYNWTAVIDVSEHYVMNGTLTLWVSTNVQNLSDLLKTSVLSGFTNDDVHHPLP